MEQAARTTAPNTTLLSWLALGTLAVGVVLAEVVALQTAESLAGQYPEFAHLHGPLVAAAIAFGLCLEVVLAITALLIGAIRHGRIFDLWALTLVDALVGALTVATVVIAVVLPMVPGPPALGLAVFGATISGVAVVLVVLVLRALLRQAVSMRLELDEVV
jgi:hypothetical protein